MWLIAIKYFNQLTAVVVYNELQWYSAQAGPRPLATPKHHAETVPDEKWFYNN